MTGRELELVNLVIDGEATEDEQRQLQSAMRRSSEVRETFDAFRALAVELETIEEELPADVVQRIRDSVGLTAAPSNMRKSEESRPAEVPERRDVEHRWSPPGSKERRPHSSWRMKGTGDQVNAQKRNFVIIGSLGVAAAIIALVMVWPPSFVKDNQATGAIGVVQKHHQTQITTKDVILTDETTRQAAKIAYADHLDDAALLQNATVALGSALQNRDLASKTVLNVRHDLQSHSTDLQSRFLGSMHDVLNALQSRNSEALGIRRLGSFQSDLGALESAARQGQLGAAQMQELNMKLASVTHDLAATTRLQSESLESAKAELAAAVNTLQNTSNLGSTHLLGASRQLENVAHTLNSSAALGSVSLEQQQAYLGSITMQAKMVESIDSELNALGSQKLNNAEFEAQLGNVARELANEANALETAGLQNMQRQLEQQTAMGSALRDMEMALGSANRAVGNRAGLEDRALQSFVASINNVTRELQNRNEQLQARAAGSMKLELAALSTHLENSMANRAKLESTWGGYGGGGIARNSSKLESTWGGNDGTGIARNSSKLESAWGNQTGTGIARNKEELNAETQLGDGGAWGRIAKNREALNAQAQLGITALQGQLKSIENALQNQSSLGLIRLRNQNELASQARALESRVSELQSKNVQSKTQQ